MTLLAAEKLTVKRGNKAVLNDVSVQLHAGEFVAMIGPNGAGKSTLLAALAGLIKPDTGRVLLDAHAVLSRSPAELAKRRAYLPQNPRAEWPLPVKRLVALGLTAQLPALGPMPSQMIDAVAQALVATGLMDQRDQPVTTLSGGEFARAMLARAIVGNPDMLIVDEPITGLDPKHAMGMMRLLSDEARRGKLVVASLHDLTLAGRHATRILALVDGHLISDTKELTGELIHKAFGVRAHLSGKGDSLALTLLSPSEK